MGERAAKVVDLVSRTSRLALVVSATVAGVAVASGYGLTIPLEVAIQRTLSDVGATGALESRAKSALDEDDVALARGLADLGAEIGRPLSKETLDRLAAAETPSAVAYRNMRGFAHGFATGAIDNSAALAGSLAADLTLVGDIRDLATEGSKAARGEEHSNLILGLAAAGVAVTAATYATAGGGAPARFGVSVLKAARRAGTMSAEFAADLGRRIAKSGDKGALKVEGRAAGGAAEGASGLTTLANATGELKAVGAAVGAGETVRLMKYVRNVDELPELRRFTTKFGARSRAVAEMTGKASLRVFKTSFRFGELLLKHLVAALAWFGSLLLGWLSKFGWRGLRFVVARV